MCGIFGVLLQPNARLGYGTVSRLLEQLYLLSESRGKESAGLHTYVPASGQAWTLKGAQRASELLRSREMRAIMTQQLRALFDSTSQRNEQGLILLAHSRLVTNGTALLARNNQPVRSGGVSMIHNGIVVNVDALWQANPQLTRTAEVDTEVMAALIGDHLQHGREPVQATREVFAAIRGAASVAWVHDRRSVVTLATNTGDLYFVDWSDRGAVVFASEEYILTNALRSAVPEQADPGKSIQWVEAGNGLVVDVAGKGRPQRFVLAARDETNASASRLAREPQHHDTAHDVIRVPLVAARNGDDRLIRYNESAMRELKRCSRCVLPVTFPFIGFDADGVCNYCRSYRPRYAHMHPTKTKEQFIESLAKYHRAGGKPDVLVAFSGGRDSSYGLHLIRKEFGFTPITFTYDWGMVTDLARRNVARICGQLGIQNILVSADIGMKRDNIRKNVAAWLKKPDLGLVPLFMAGDKHFFRIVNQLKRQTGIVLDLWCANPLENTDFKSGLCGIRPDFDKSRVDYLSFTRKLQLASYYSAQFLRNPRYLNSSLQDTFGAFLAYYVEPRRDFYFIFDHFIWNENEVNDVLLSQYDWELSPDSPSTWRIGDGTAPFYNYIYMTSSGFTEFDTFRSNQIREGMISREAALEAILVENRPRIESLHWYLDTIGLEFDVVVRRINELDTRGLHR
jgi:glutamine---fructose-6-phosphate transaminase (isomerizing)